MLIAFRGSLILPDEVVDHGVVLCKEGRIASIHRGKAAASARIPARAEVVEAPYISPGFVDLHVHGGGGADYMDGTPEAVRIANHAHLRRGTTTLFPTTTTGSPQQITRMLQACVAVREQHQPGEARIAGVHLYGPYFAENKVGCHKVEGRRDPADRKEYEGYFRTGIVRIATCAAELPHAVPFYRTAVKRGCALLTCGHSDSTWTQMQRAFDAGVRHVDHFWCAMSSVPSLRARYGTPMQASMAEFVLAQPEMSTEVIADGEHLSKELLEFAWRMKGEKRLCLVTDANRALGMPPGRYRFGPIEDGSWFESNGKVGFVPEAGGGLASAVVALDTMVRNMKRMTSAPLAAVVRMASLTPAERAGVAHEVGSLEPGKFADIVLLDARLRVKSVFTAGRRIGAEPRAGG